MFTHLHVHSDFSLLDGVIQLHQLIEKLQKIEMKSCALTDHGNMYGAYKFQTMMQKAGLKPILGSEIYISPRSMYKKEHGIDNKYYHLVLLAKNFQGYKNLIKIISLSQMEGFYYKPRIDYENLKKYSEGLIALSGCMQGILSRPIYENNIKLAENNLQLYLDLFKEDFYIEIQRNGLKEQEIINKHLLELSNKYKTPIVATCDTHYLEKDDYELQEILWCIRDGKTIDDPLRMKSESKEFYLKNEEEMKELFKDLPEAIENTELINNKIEVYPLEFKRVEPVYLNLPKGKTSKQLLKELVYENVESKYGKLTKELKERLDYELEVINTKGYDDYFLIVKDFVKYCRDNNITVGIRGSACGSAVAYCVGITHVEPIEWELYFERFLNPERKSPPDIDIDIADTGRDEVIQFAIDMFGKDNVKQIGTFSKLQTRQAIRDISRVLGIDLAIADRLSKMVVIEFGKSKPLDYMIEKDKEFAELINSTDELKRMASIVRKLSGLHRGISTHASGVIITPEPVTEYVPIQKDAHGEGMGLSQYEMFDTEEIGLMKFDFLGLRNLSIIGETVKMVKRTKGIDIDVLTLKPDLKEAFKLIQEGNTVGVFQLESEGMKKVLKGLKPETLEEISYVLAAYRPGPLQFIPEYIDVKNKKKEPEYLIPALEPILSVTNGVITYQEQVIRIAVDIAGYTMGAADMLRKAMGKKKMEIMEQEKPKFIEGAVAKGYEKEKIEKIWERLLQFANYGFNKAHSASYAYVTYWTAYLKAMYPTEFMASLLQSDLNNFNHVIIDMEECKRLGIEVLPPNINKSDYYFTLEDGKNMRFGLAGIKNVGEDISKAIVKERLKNGEYKNLDDFIYRLLPSKLSTRSVEFLIKSGTMDMFGKRERLLAIMPNLIERYQKKRKKDTEGQIDLFGSNKDQGTNILIEATQLPEVEEINDFQILQWEKELLGLYLSSHPLDKFENFFIEKKVEKITNIKNKNDGDVVILGGTVSKIKRITTKSKQNMAFVSLEDKTGVIDLVLFPRVYESSKDELKPDIPILFAGRISSKDEVKSVIIEKIKTIDIEKHQDKFEGIILNITDDNSEEEINTLKSYIIKYPGETKVKIICVKKGIKKEILLKNGVNLHPQFKEYINKFSQ